MSPGKEGGGREAWLSGPHLSHVGALLVGPVVVRARRQAQLAASGNEGVHQLVRLVVRRVDDDQRAAAAVVARVRRRRLAVFRFLRGRAAAAGPERAGFRGMRGIVRLTDMRADAP